MTCCFNGHLPGLVVVRLTIVQCGLLVEDSVYGEGREDLIYQEHGSLAQGLM